MQFITSTFLVMAKTNNHLVIMAGGVGSRFWPMSTADRPKQFIDVLGVGKSLLQLTVERFGNLIKPENIWVVTNQHYAAIVKEQLPDMPESNILCEPCRRNTAPCIAYVSWRIKSKDPKANIVVTPSDHIVTDTAEFQRVIKECMVFTSETDAIVTLGMKPNRPETGRFFPRKAKSGNGKRIYQEKLLFLERRYLYLECQHHCQCIPCLSAFNGPAFRVIAPRLWHEERAGRDQPFVPRM